MENADRLYRLASAVRLEGKGSEKKEARNPEAGSGGQEQNAEAAKRIDADHSAEAGRKARRHELIVAREILEAEIQGANLTLLPGQALILPPGKLRELRGANGAAASCDRFGFEVYTAEADGELALGGLDWPLRPVTLPAGRAAELAQAVLDGWSGTSAPRMEAGIRFQELLLCVWRASESAADSTAEAVRRSAARMEETFGSSLTREGLAAEAGLSVAHYSRLFKREFGQGPIEYLNGIRLRRARELLLETGGSVRETAHRVGYEDEFYFSRKFKAATGLAPTVYMRAHRAEDRIASIAIPYTGHLLALGLRPCAALLNPYQEPAGELRNLLELGNEQPDLQRLRQARPGLIIGFERQDYAGPGGSELLGEIAPVCRIPFGGEWREHLLTIGRTVGREERASRWLEQYEDRAERARRLIGQRIGSAAVAVAQYERGMFRVYGSRNLGTVLYRDLGLAMPERLHGVSHSVLLTAGQLADSGIDRLLLFTSDDPRLRRQARHSLREQAQRRPGMAAFFENLHDLGASRAYSCYTSTSHDTLLRRLTQTDVLQKSMS
ncbi:AraC family transcriptional regulator [Saccharibacillus sp. CPCC 101409]|uniref:AraC family transcriptional regulator n=1 Tax=Saccharibacillus sp. CPCC 101409 TaxID=3058041 RepID=UPI002671CA98|nr:AraC family transcriptional regulator [Saccharibacillus sp. CPCC 101409]MDO3408953.1 AraC family transcriptional regulator [Saccharibacillus sp. CPCC 101409]